MDIIERNFLVKIEAIQIDWGGSFKFFDTQLGNLGLTRRVTCPYTSKYNEVVGLRDKRVIGKCMALLLQAGLYLDFWVHVVRTIVFIINRLSASVLIS